MPRLSETPSAANPFPGPKPYGRGEDAFFFGRQDEIDELTTLVLSTSAVVLDAPSGTGKSSLINAGLLPNLKREHFESIVHIQFGKPASLIPSGLQAEPGGGSPNPFSDIVRSAIMSETAAEGDDLVSAMTSLGQVGKGLHLLVLDQFEEIFFNFPEHWAARSPFFRDLEHGLKESPNLRALIAIRSDYLASLMPYQRQLPGELVVRYSLESLREEAAREAVAQVFAQTGRPLDDLVLDDLVANLLTTRSGSGGPPFKGEFVNLIQLQVVCQRLWEAQSEPPTSGNGQASSLESPVSHIDVETAMDDFVDGAIANVVAATPADEPALRGWLQSEFVTPAGHRNLLRVGQGPGGEPDAVVAQLDRVRLVSVEQRNQDRWVELTHDSMVAAVQRSNARWQRAHARRRHAVQVGLVAILAALAGLFLPLRNRLPSCGSEICAQGPLGSGRAAITSQTVNDKVTFVLGSIDNLQFKGPNQYPTLSLMAGGQVITQTFAPSDPTSSTTSPTAGLALEPGHQSFSAEIQSGAGVLGDGRLNIVRVRPVLSARAIRIGKRASVRDYFAIQVAPSSPFVLRYSGRSQPTVVLGAESSPGLGGDAALIRPGKDDTYALFQAPFDTNTDVGVEAFPDPVGNAGPKTSINQAGSLATLLIPPQAPRTESIDVVCENNQDIAITVLDSASHTPTATLVDDTTNDRANHGAFLAATLAPGAYRLVIVASRATKRLTCQVQTTELTNLLSVAQPEMGPLQVKAPIDPASGHAGYWIASTVDSVAVINVPQTLQMLLSCGDITTTFPQLPSFPGYSAANLAGSLALLPAGRPCLVIVHRVSDGATGAATVSLAPLPNLPGGASSP